MGEHRPYRNYPAEELYRLIAELEATLEDKPGVAHLEKMLAVVEDEIDRRDWE